MELIQRLLTFFFLLFITVQSNRGVSYIEYANRSDAEKAIAHMDNGQLDGKVLVCVFGEPPRRRSPTPPPARRRRMYLMCS